MSTSRWHGLGHLPDPPHRTGPRRLHPPYRTLRVITRHAYVDLRGLHAVMPRQLLDHSQGDPGFLQALAERVAQVMGLQVRIRRPPPGALVLGLMSGNSAAGEGAGAPGYVTGGAEMPPREFESLLTA